VNELIRRVQDFWQGLAPREQILVGSAGAALALTLLVFAFVMPVLGLADSATERVQSAENQLVAMQRLQREYGDIDSRLRSVEDRIRKQQGRSNINTELATLAQQSGVAIKSMEPRAAGNDDHYEETKVEVKLEKVSLEQAVKYLHNIEISDRQLSIKSLRIKSRKDNSNLLDVSFAVSAFDPA